MSIYLGRIGNAEVEPLCMRACIAYAFIWKHLACRGQAVEYAHVCCMGIYFGSIETVEV